MDKGLALTELVRVTPSDSGPQVQVSSVIDSERFFALYGHALRQTTERLLRRAVRAGASRTGVFGVAFSSGEEHQARVLAAAIRVALTRVAQLPIEQYRVETALKISHRECNRWTKDGRLPTSGTLLMSRAPRVRIQRSTYSPNVIADLVAHPERIEAWRASDSAQP